MFTKKRKSLDTILSSFNKTIEDLETLKSGNKAQVATNTAIIANLNVHNSALLTEHDAAHNVHQNLSALVSGKKT